MKSQSFFNRLRHWLTSVTLATLIGTLLLLNAAAPAMAAGSDATQGEAQLQSVKESTDRAAKSGPRDMEAVQEKGQSGLNGVQGDTSRDKMKHSGTSEDVTTVREQLGDALKEANPMR